MKKLLIMIAILTLLAFSFGSLAQQNGYDLFQKALAKERAEGNLEEAIALYQKVIDETKDESLAAKAQLRIGICYEKLGKQEAQRAYQKVIDNYPRQIETVKIAQQKLSSLLKAYIPTERKYDSLAVRKVWETRFNDPLGPPSPDGSYLPCYDGNGNLSVYDLATDKLRSLTDGASWTASFAYKAVFSPDGKQLAYAWRNKEYFWDLWIINIDGSDNRLLCRSKSQKSIIPMNWSNDGKKILAHSKHEGNISEQENEIVMVSVPNGELKRIYEFKKNQSTNIICFSPDGRFIVFDIADFENQSCDISILPVSGGREISLVSHPASDHVLGWMPDGKNILFSSDRKGSIGIWMRSVENGKPQGIPKLVKQDVGPIGPLGITLDGSFYYQKGGWEFDIYEAVIDLSRKKLAGPQKPAIYRSMGNNTSLDWSKDAKYMAYHSFSSSMGARGKLWICNENTGEEYELEPKLGTFHELYWSPDGSKIATYGRDMDNRPGYFSIDIQSGNVRPIILREIVKGAVNFIGWAGDGKSIFYQYEKPKDFYEIRKKEIDAEKEDIIYKTLEKNVHIGSSALSRDGHKIAFIKWQGEEKSQHLMVMTIQGEETRELFRTQPGNSIKEIVWTPDDHYLLITQEKNTGYQEQSELWIVGSRGEDLEKIGELDKFAWGLRIHPNGEKIAFTVADKKTEVWIMENFLPDEKTGRGGEK